MSNVFVDLLPLILAATLTPIYPLIVLLLLQSERGLGRATAFVAGVVVVRLVQGVLFGLVLAPAIKAEIAADLEVIGPTLLTMLGILLLVMGVRKWRNGGDDADEEEPSRWMSAFTGMSTLKAVFAGATQILLSVKQWFITLSAIGLIEEAQPGIAAGVGLYLIFMLATQLLVLLPILAFAVAPQKSADPLRKTYGWLQSHSRVVVVTVSLVFGLFILYRGIIGLLAIRGM